MIILRQENSELNQKATYYERAYRYGKINRIRHQISDRTWMPILAMCGYLGVSNASEIVRARLIRLGMRTPLSIVITHLGATALVGWGTYKLVRRPTEQEEFAYEMGDFAHPSNEWRQKA